MFRMKGYTKICLLLMASLFSLTSAGQDNILKSFNNQGNSFTLEVNNGKYHIQLYNSKIAHTAFYPDSGVVENFAFAEDMKQINVAYQVDSSRQKYVIQTEGMRIEVEK